MAAPTVTPLPTPPSRLSRRDTFVTEANVFLEALPTFRTQVNLLSTYINSKSTNIYNYGKINGVRNFPNIFQTTLVNTYYDGDSVDFTSWVDSMYTVLQEYSTTLNNAGVWLDSVLNEVGEFNYDVSKPMVSGITDPMVRNQSIGDFNTRAINFSGSSINNINSLYLSLWYVYIVSCSNEDNGSVTDNTIILNIDCGSITDTPINYNNSWGVCFAQIIYG